MNSSDEVEKLAVELVMPLILRGGEPEAPVIDTKLCQQREFIQRNVGDFLVLSNRTRQWVAIEVKGERRFTGNLFVEAWSNKSSYRTRDGWIFTLRSDLLFMVYLDVQAAFVVPLPALQKWCIEEGNMYRYDEKAPHLEQWNRTTGHPVPFADLPASIGVRMFRVRNGVWAPCTLSDLQPVRIFRSAN